MATLHVKLRQSESQRVMDQELELDGVRIRLRSIYSKRTDSWTLSIFDTSGTLVVGGIAVVPGVDLLLPYRHLDLPQGELFSYSRAREAPTFVTADVSSVTLYREE